MRQPLIFLILERLATFSLLIPILSALVNYKFLARPLKVIFFFIAFSFTLNMINLYCATHHIHNLAVFHFYAIFELGFILWFFSYYVDGILKKAIIPLVAIFAIWSIFNFFFIQKGLQFNTYTRPIEALIITLFSAAFFNAQTQSDPDHRWGSFGANWINSGLLLFYASSFFIFLFSNFFLANNGKAATIYFWTSYNVILIIENLLFTIGFAKSRNKPTGPKV